MTHPEMTRYFMTIPEASQLILQALCLGQEWDFCVGNGHAGKDRGPGQRLDPDFPARSPGRDIEVIFTGLGAGEKLPTRNC